MEWWVENVRYLKSEYMLRKKKVVSGGQRWPLPSTKEIMRGHKIIHIDMTRGLDLCAQKKVVTRTDVQQWEQKEDKSEQGDKN